MLFPPVQDHSVVQSIPMAGQFHGRTILLARETAFLHSTIATTERSHDQKCRSEPRLRALKQERVTWSKMS